MRSEGVFVVKYDACLSLLLLFVKDISEKETLKLLGRQVLFEELAPVDKLRHATPMHTQVTHLQEVSVFLQECDLVLLRVLSLIERNGSCTVN